MQRAEFNTMSHHANMYVRYCDETHYVISVNFTEALFALVPDKDDYPADEWTWVRCESVSLLKSEVVAFPSAR